MVGKRDYYYILCLKTVYLLKKLVELFNKYTVFLILKKQELLKYSQLV